MLTRAASRSSPAAKAARKARLLAVSRVPFEAGQLTEPAQRAGAPALEVPISDGFGYGPFCSGIVDRRWLPLLYCRT
jgi:hypothetical protein